MGDPSHDGAFPRLVEQAREIFNNANARPFKDTPGSSRCAMLGQNVKAEAAYVAEGEGYLSFQKGDRLKICWGSTEQPGPQDQFKAYIYGRHMDPTLRASAATPVLLVCFPIDLVRFL